MKMIINSAQNLIVFCEDCEDVDTGLSEISIQEIKNLDELIYVLENFKEKGYEVEVWDTKTINKHLREWLGR